MQKLDTLTDEELAKLHADGNTAASGVLLYRYKNAVKAICRQFFLVGGDEEDLMQEGMIALFGCISQYDPKFGAFGPYASRCVKNRVIDAVRKSSRNKNKPLADFVDVQSISDGELLYSSDADPETLYLSAEGEKLILKSIDETLCDDEKEVFLLFLDGLGYSEIGSKTSLSIKQVDNRLQKIKRKLKSANQTK